MSDLDADLYGDLYGNDENEFAVPTTELPEEQPVKVIPEQTKQEGHIVSKEEPHTEPISSTISAHTPSAPEYEDVKPHTIQTNTPPPTSSIPSYTSPPAQQIPTYEERQPTDLRELPPPRHDAVYQGVPGVDRPVRPSEMKEEGFPVSPDVPCHARASIRAIVCVAKCSSAA
ncbi:hypothetical protein BC628DRAFT_833993 [Trametes gibbosa]|nr:hypothetical protein BC628DRAFT_833993 [Trametes gibbosa]